jgi:hypothetical protein
MGLISQAHGNKRIEKESRARDPKKSFCPGGRVRVGPGLLRYCGCIPPNALPYCAAGMDPRVGYGSTDLGELVRGLKL